MKLEITLTTFAAGLAELLKANDRGRGDVIVIAKGEHGIDARPMHPDWATSLRDDCIAAGINFQFAGWGAWVPISRKPVLKDRREMFLHSAGMTTMRSGDEPFDPWERGHPNWQPMRRVSTKIANATPLDWRCGR